MPTSPFSTSGGTSPADSAGGGRTILAASDDASPHDDTSAVAGTTYYYFAKACNGTGCSDLSAHDTGYRAVAAPSAPTAPAVTASDGGFTDKVRVSWGSVSGATYYQVFRAASAGGGKTTLSPFDTASPHDDTSAVAGTTYYYFAKACNGTGCSDYSAYNTGYRATTTNTFVVSADNLLLISSKNRNIENTAYSTAENLVGCNWDYSSLTGIQDFICAVSLLYFDVNSTINNKTILNATLKLYPAILPAAYTTYQTWAIFENRSAFVTWSTMPQIYSGSNVVFNQPTSALPVEIDVTQIVRNWANGSRSNYGFLIEDVNYLFPYAIELRSSTFCSKEQVPSCSANQRPELVIEYQ